MQKTRLLLGVIIGFSIAFIGLRIFKQDTLADFVRPVILPLVTVLFYLRTKKTSGYFFNFLLLYSISELLSLIYYYIPFSKTADNFMYFGCNSLYIASYVFLILYILKLISIKEMFNKFTVHLIVLLALDLYCIILVTDIAFKSENLSGIFDFVTEIVYNATIMILLTVAVINYLNNDSKKSMNLLLGSICIVFSEVIQVAYFYVSEIYLLNIAYCILLVVGFALFYIQYNMSMSEVEEYKTLENLEA